MNNLCDNCNSNIETAYQCAYCNDIHYCSKICKLKHLPKHMWFCKDRHNYTNLERLCEYCGEKTSFGCKQCTMAYCSSKCYTIDDEKHKIYCKPILESASPNPMDKIKTLKNGMLMIICPNPTLSRPYYSKNIFNIHTDKRTIIKESIIEQKWDNIQYAYLIEDYYPVTRMCITQLMQLLCNSYVMIEDYKECKVVVDKEDLEWQRRAKQILKIMNKEILIFSIELNHDLLYDQETIINSMNEKYSWQLQSYYTNKKTNKVQYILDKKLIRSTECENFEQIMKEKFEHEEIEIKRRITQSIMELQYLAAEYNISIDIVKKYLSYPT